MKRLSIAIVVMACIFGGEVASGVTILLPEENFDDDATGIPPAGWTEVYAGVGGSPTYTREQAAELGVSQYVTDTIYFGFSGKSLHVDKNSTSIASSLRHGFPASPLVTLEYCVRPTNTTEGGAEIRLENDSSSSSDYQLEWDDTHFRVRGGGPHINIMEYTPGTWYRVKRYVDFNTNTGYLRIEDAEDPSVFEQVSLEPRPEMGGYISRFNIGTAVSAPADFYIDNILVTVPEPSSCALTAFALFGFVWYGWRRRTSH